MKAQGYIWNNEYISKNESFYKKVTVEFYITREMIQSFIDKSGVKGWKIEHLGYQYLSNKNRNVVRLSMTNTVSFFEYWVSVKLDVAFGSTESYSKVRNAYIIDYYRYELDKMRSAKLPCVLVWDKNKGYGLQRRSTPVTYKSEYQNGRHFVAMSHILC